MAHMVTCVKLKRELPGLDEEIEDAITANTQLSSMEDFIEGVRAFRQHRKAEWPSRRVKA